MESSISHRSHNKSKSAKFIRGAIKQSQQLRGTVRCSRPQPLNWSHYYIVWCSITAIFMNHNWLQIYLYSLLFFYFPKWLFLVFFQSSDPGLAVTFTYFCPVKFAQQSFFPRICTSAKHNGIFRAMNNNWPEYISICHMAIIIQFFHNHDNLSRILNCSWKVCG